MQMLYVSVFIRLPEIELPDRGLVDSRVARIFIRALLFAVVHS